MGPHQDAGVAGYDFSAVPTNQRDQVLVVWNAPHASGYINDKVEAYAVMPVDYTIEVNSAPGGAMPPAAGWTAVANVKTNNRGTVEHLVALGKNNWVRMNITASSDPTGALAIDLDVYSAPCGASDTWMFMGDSITYMTMPYAFRMCRRSRMPPRPLAGRWRSTQLSAARNHHRQLDHRLDHGWLPGRFVVLAYGTNDHAAELQMDGLVQKVIAAGKTPVVPHMPWSQSAGIQKDGPLINDQIDALYKKYPKILPGPDLWATFKDRTDLIPAGDVHPNSAGQIELRKTWAAFIAGVP